VAHQENTWAAFETLADSAAPEKSSTVAAAASCVYELPLNDIGLYFYDRFEIRIARLCLPGLAPLGYRISPLVEADCSWQGTGGCALHHRAQEFAAETRQ